MEETREQKIRLWFNMWLQAKDLGIENIFSPDCTYIESWGPKYEGRAKVALWFREWNTRGRVVRWDIEQFFHRGGPDGGGVVLPQRDERRDRGGVSRPLSGPLGRGGPHRLFAGIWLQHP